jgi:hypothetical protein
MSKARFKITYSIVDEESCQHGDSAYHGFLTRNETCPRRRFNPQAKPATFDFRNAIRIMRDHDSGSQGVSASDSPWGAGNPPRWLSVTDWPGYMPTEDCTELNLHLEKVVTDATACRIARLLGTYGEYKPKPE